MVSIQLKDSTLLDKLDHQRKIVTRAQSCPDFRSLHDSDDPNEVVRGDVQAGGREVNEYLMLHAWSCCQILQVLSRSISITSIISSGQCVPRCNHACTQPLLHTHTHIHVAFCMHSCWSCMHAAVTSWCVMKISMGQNAVWGTETCCKE